MDKIIIHWTAGGYYPNAVDRAHYHFLVDKNGKVYNGNYAPKDNENCYDGKYAAHTGGGNTRAIGVGLCGMASFVDKHNVGHYPLTKKQCESAFKLIAQLAKRYNIPVDSKHVMTHYEFGLKNPKTISRGKIDIIYLPPYPDVSQEKVGNFVRQKIRWYLQYV